MLDVLINKLIKQYIKEYEDLWVEQNFELWQSRKWLIRDRRVLITHWVTQAFERVYVEHKDAIIACFKNVGLLLAMDGSEDYMLKVRDCLNLTVGDWQKAPKGTVENPAIIDEDREDIIKVDDNTIGLLYTAQEVAEGIKIKEEDKNNVTTDLGINSEQDFDLDKEESDFNDIIDGDEDMEDENL